MRKNQFRTDTIFIVCPLYSAISSVPHVINSRFSHFNSSAASKAFSFRSRVLAFEISYDLCSRKVRMTSQIQIRYL